MDETTTNVEESPTKPKTALIRKVLIAVAATAGLLIAGGVLLRQNSDLDELEDRVEDIEGFFVFEPVETTTDSTE